MYGQQKAKVEGILVRQRGLLFKPGKGIEVGTNYTLFAIREGFVYFKTKGKEKFVHVLKKS